MKGWALVTGAAQRIGRAIALDLAANGWDIVLHYNRSADEAEQTAEEISRLNRQVVLAEIDLLRTDHVVKLISSLAAEIGALTALVNNASLFEPDSADPDGHLHKTINADAPRLLSQAFYHQVPADGHGAIVNILDGVPPEKGMKAYNRSKQELEKDTLLLAKNFAPRVCVNGVAPGPVLRNARQSEAHHRNLIDETPLKIAITPEDVAHAVTFLLSSPAITGEILHVNGGRNLNQSGQAVSEP